MKHIIINRNAQNCPYIVLKIPGSLLIIENSDWDELHKMYPAVHINFDGFQLSHLFYFISNKHDGNSHNSFYIFPQNSYNRFFLYDNATLFFHLLPLV